jgi:hypothetical protein
MSELLSREALLSSSDLPRERVDLRPDLDGSVLVQGLTVQAMDRVDEIAGEDRDNFVPLLCAACMIDEAGAPMLALEDHDQLARLPARAVMKIFDAASRLSGLADTTTEQAKNSSTTPGDDSSFASP